MPFRLFQAFRISSSFRNFSKAASLPGLASSRTNKPICVIFIVSIFGCGWVDFELPVVSAIALVAPVATTRAAVSRNTLMVLIFFSI